MSRYTMPRARRQTQFYYLFQAQTIKTPVAVFLYRLGIGNVGCVDCRLVIYAPIIMDPNISHQHD